MFAAISGAAVATTVAIGMVMIPAMQESGYDLDVATAVTATASCMGPIIPPSIPLIMYGVVANVSITALFLAGVFPGILLGAALMIYMYLLAKKRKYPLQQRSTFRELAVSFWKSIPSLLMPVIVMGGILGGVFTATEAAGVVVVYGFLVGLIIKRELTLKRIPAVLLKSGLESAMVMLLLALSEPFSWVVAAEQIPEMAVTLISQISTSPYVLLLLVNIFLIIVGIPLETGPAITIVAPVLAPIAIKMGIDPVHMGIVVCFNLVLGLITPPVGAVLFAACGIAKIKLDQLSKAIWPPFAVSLVVLLIVTYIPAIATWLPNLVLAK
jgi:C4-dicarboxylate transporter DctM subunit